MKRFTNIYVKKEYNKLIRNIIISILIIFIGVGFKFWQIYIEKEAEKQKKDMNSVIVDRTSDRKNRISYIDNRSVPFQFAVSESTTNSYYFVSDGRYLYIVFMSPKQFEKLDKEYTDDSKVRIEGITKNIPNDVRSIALEVYNESVKEENVINDNDFENYFGDIYLDMTESKTQVAGFQWFMFYACIICGGIAFIICLAKLIKLTKKINKMDGNKIDELDSEMNNKDSFYYAKAHLYLTPHYIINFDGYFDVIKYEDVLWMYRYEVRTNGVKSSQSIKVLANDGVTYLLATIDVYSKKKKEVYEEIWNTIYSKNPNMLLGYTEENINAMDEKIKEIKAKK